MVLIETLMQRWVLLQGTEPELYKAEHSVVDSVPSTRLHPKVERVLWSTWRHECEKKQHLRLMSPWQPRQLISCFGSRS